VCEHVCVCVCMHARVGGVYAYAVKVFLPSLE
jgi:hypothetical protein